ncbi:hypothetical protein IAT38_003217 [Cryptococcus sp. DSM 104549]
MGRRLGDATCAICMDGLFDKRDDLDDLIPIGTCDCGHVFHEPCLLQWFQTGTMAWLREATDRGVTNEHGQPVTLADAPAECPSCRAECFADENGRIMVHRLFINFEGRSSSAAPRGSSPEQDVKPGLAELQRHREKEKEVERRNDELLGLAKRAKELTEEVKNIKPESREEEVNVMMGRAVKMEEDVQRTAKANSAIKKYAGGLIAAINRLSTTIEEHPLIPVLQTRISDCKHEVQGLQREMSAAIPREVKKARDEEQAISEKRVQRVVADFEAIKRELEKERVTSKAGRRALEEKVRDVEKQLAEAQRRLAVEVGDREKLQSTLNDRSRQLNIFRKENESRRALKAELKEAKEENANLLTLLQAAQAKASKRRASPGFSPDNLRSTPSVDIALEDDDGPLFEGDSSVMEISGSAFPARTLQRRSSGADSSSLQIDMPSFHDESLRGLSRLLPQETDFGAGSSRGKSSKAKAGSPDKRPAARGHPTARTMTFDLDGDPLAKRRKTNSSRYFLTTETGGKRTSAAWLDGDESDADVAASGLSRDLDRSPSASPERMHPAFGKKSAGNGGNPFAAKKQDAGKRHEIPPARQPPPPSSQARGLGSASYSSEVLVPASSPPQKTQRAMPAPLGKSASAGGQQSMVAWLGIADANGRPKAGVATGQKVKRKL